MDNVRKILMDFGLAKDSQRLAMLQQIFDPKLPESLTIIPTRKQVIHLNYMEGLAKIIGGEVGAFIESLRQGEIQHLKSLKGLGLEKYTDIMQNQSNAQEITVRNESIPQQLQEKQGFWGRLTGGKKE